MVRQCLSRPARPFHQGKAAREALSAIRRRLRAVPRRCRCPGGLARPYRHISDWQAAPPAPAQDVDRVPPPSLPYSSASSCAAMAAGGCPTRTSRGFADGFAPCATASPPARRGPATISQISQRGARMPRRRMPVACAKPSSAVGRPASRRSLKAPNARPGAARRCLEQQPQEPPLRDPQQEPPRQSQQQRRLPPLQYAPIRPEPRRSRTPRARREASRAFMRE